MTSRAYAAARALSNDPSATPAERENARQRCAEHEAAHGKPATEHGKRPWWTLRVSAKGSGRWLANVREFRQALRDLRDGRKDYEHSFEWDTVKAVQDRRVDWVGFSDREPWHVPSEIVSAYKAQVARPLGKHERVVEWEKPEPPRAKMGTPKRRPKLRDGELPGRRMSKRKPN